MAKKLLLPQDDPQGKQQRQQYLKKMRQIYEYQFNFCGNIAQLKKLHLREWNEPILFLIILVKLVLFLPIAIWAYLKTLIKGYPFKEEKKCQIPGFPTKLNTIDQVIEIIGNIIFIASAHHSAIHYTMYQHLAYVPNMPLSLYAPPSINSEGLELMKLLPTFYNTIIQSFGFYINNIKVIRIGKYNLSMFDGRSNEIIKKYQEKLQEISNEVNARNQERIFPYIFLDPKNIANSIIV